MEHFVLSYDPKKPIPPCVKDCKGRNCGCHLYCKAYLAYEKEIGEYRRKAAIECGYYRL